MVTTRPMTAEDLLRLPDGGSRYELIAGLPRRMPVGGLEHGWIGSRFVRHLGAFDRRRLGIVVGPDTLFRFSRDPDYGLIPDAAFLGADRLPPRSQWWDVAEVSPDLVVEVVSPHDTRADVAEKVAYYLAHGVVIAWVAYPAPRQVVVHRADRAPLRLSVGDTLDGEDVLPGFRLPLFEIFD